MNERDNRHRLSGLWELRELWTPRLTTLLIGSIVLLGTAGLLVARSLATLREGNTRVNHTEQVRIEIGQVLQLLTDVETGVRGYALTADKEFLDSYRTAMPQLPSEFVSLKNLVADNSAQRSNAEQLESRANACLTHAQEVIRRAESGEMATAGMLISSSEGKRRMDAARGAAAQMQAEEMRLLELRRAASEQASKRFTIPSWSWP